MKDDISKSVPYLSVIICAHNRKTYLLDAISSVLNQTIEKKMFEIILVKNFLDPDIDSFVEKNVGIKSIFTEAQNLSNKQAVGIREASGSIICFLDDDDLFVPERLSVLTSYFEQNENLSFIHNGMIFIDLNGEELQKSPSFGNIQYRHNLSRPSTIKKMLTQMAGYNPSSMAISRNLAIAYLDVLEKTFREVDTFWFACALDYGEKSIVIPDHLTKYRRHSGGLSRASDSRKVFEYAKAAIDNMSIINSNLKSNISRQYIQYKLDEWYLKMIIFDPEKAEILPKVKAFQSLIKLINLIPVREFLKLSSLIFLSIFSQDLALSLYPTLYA